MYIMCLVIFEEKAVVQDQYPLSLNPDQKADDPIQDRYRSTYWVNKKIESKFIPRSQEKELLEFIKLSKSFTLCNF